MTWFLAAAKKALLQAKTVTAGTSNISVSPDSGYDGLSSVTVQPTPSESKEVTAGTDQSTVTPTSGKLLSSVVVNPTPSQTKSVTATTSVQTVTPDSGKLLSSVTVNPQNHTGTYTAISRGAALDMGANNNNRYVNTNSVPNSNSETYTFPVNDTGGTKDLGDTNGYRYVNAQNVYNKGKADSSSIKFDTALVYSSVWAVGISFNGSNYLGKQSGDTGNFLYYYQTSVTIKVRCRIIASVGANIVLNRIFEVNEVISASNYTAPVSIYAYPV